MTTIVDFRSNVEDQMLVLKGSCADCGGEVARVIEEPTATDM